MANSKISVGIIGAGRMGITHYSIINSHPDIKVTAVADPSPLVLSVMGKYLPIDTYKDYADLIDKAKPDVLLVCTPPNLHYEILKMASTRGIHVFVEKPFTTSYSAAKELANLFEENNLVNQVGYVNRYNDVFRYVKKLIDSQVLGQIFRFRSEMFSCTITKSEDKKGWRASHEMGGGVVFEMASHAIDLVNFLLGSPSKVVGTTFNKIYSSEVEDVVSSTFIYSSGVKGTLYVNWSDDSFRKPTNKIELFSEKGKLLADQHSVKIFLKEENKKMNFKKGWNTVYITDIAENVPFYVRGNEFTRQLYHFVSCVKNNETPICSFRDASLTHEVIEKMFSDEKKNS